MTTTRKLVANSASGLAGRFVNLFVQIWLYQYLIKRISPQEYSLYPVVMALMIFVPPLLVVLTAGLVRNTVEAHARNDDQRVTEITSTLFPILLASAFVLILVGLAATKYLDIILKIDPQYLYEARLMVALLFGSLALHVASLPFSVGLYVRQKFVLLNTLGGLQTITRAALLFVLLLGLGPRVLWVVVAAVVPDVIVVFTTLILSFRALPTLRFRFACIRWGLLPDLMSFGFWSMITSLGGMIRRSSDLLILNRFATAVDIDTFHLASLSNNQIDAAMQKLNEPLTPHMVELHATGEHKALQRFCIRGGRYGLWATLLVATVLIGFRHQLWSLYLGSKLGVFADVPVVMVLLLAHYWIDAPAYYLGKAAYAMGRIRTLSLLITGSSIFNVGITIYFVHFRHMGAIGSAIGTLIAVLVFAPWIIKHCLNLVGLKFGPWLRSAVGRGIVPSIIAGLFAWAVDLWMNPETIWQLLLALSAVSSIYVLSILLFCVDEQERSWLKHLLARFSSRTVYKALASRIEF